MISSLIKKAKSLGYVSVGISQPKRPMFFDRFREWVGAGKQGDMLWMEKHPGIRENPQKLLEGCRAIISLAYPYSSTKPLTSDGFSTARYTEPEKADYHNRLKKLAHQLVETLLELYPGCRTRICVDSAPILERSFAYASGIGFIGKNNAIIIPGHGSYVFLSEILTTAQLPLPQVTPMPDQCGACNRCLNACPTGALEAPYSLNASKCLSYLTIEYRGNVKGPVGEIMGNCFFGCDVCQEVCPFNETTSSEGPVLPSTDEILGMAEEYFKIHYGETAFSRAGLKKIKSNIKAVRSMG